MRTFTPYQALWLSLAAALCTIGLKAGAWWMTGSVGFLSDALESLVNLLGASFALAMVAYARTPADRGHPSGHGKAEYFSSAFEGVLIAVAAIGILATAMQRLRDPQPLESLGLGATLSVLATIINLVAARTLLRTGRAHRSLATEADGRHLMTDVWTTAGVVVGVGLAGLSGWLWLDPVVAIFVALNILREGWRLIRQSINGLMDSALPDEEIQEIQMTLERITSEGGTFANLRTRLAGATRFAFVELHVPADWSVERADALATRAERALTQVGVALVVRVKPST